MRRKIVRFLVAGAIITAIIIAIGNVVLAAPSVNLNKPDGDEEIVDVGSKALGYVYYICTAFSIGAIMLAGVQFMTAAPEGKADVKKRSIYIGVGGLLLFGIVNIIKMVSTLTKNNIKN